MALYAVMILELSTGAEDIAGPFYDLREAEEFKCPNPEYDPDDELGLRYKIYKLEPVK